jgi:surfeit locus 1 family protein
MYRFLRRPRWVLFTVVILGLVVLMVNLALWQLRRLDQRRQFNATVTSHSQVAPEPIEQVLTATTRPAAVDWRRVTATGTYLADQQVVVVDRSQDGAAGVDVVVPLRLADGTLVLVDRGFVESSRPVPATPPGTVTVLGRLRGTETHHFGAIDDTGPGPFTELHRLNVPLLSRQLAARTGGSTLPMYLDMLSSEPADPAVAPVPDPQLDDGPHLSYAIQWCFFSLCAIAGWVLAVRRSARKRQQQAAADAAHPAPSGHVDAIDAVQPTDVDQPAASDT